MAKKVKLTEEHWEIMAAYAYGFFYGKSGYELDAPYSSEDDLFRFVMRGFMDGHENYILFDHDEDYEPYDFDVPEDEDGKYVHINTGD